MDSEITIPPGNASAGLPGLAGNVLPTAARRQRPTWTLMALAVAAALIAGALAQHARDQKNAARDLYRTQVLTTEVRFFAAENHQVALAGQRRSLLALSDLADSITGDQGVNGSGTLNVSTGAGAALSAQIVQDVTIASPYASTTLVTYSIKVPAGTSPDEGACVLSSTLLGQGRASRDLQLGGGYFVPSCPLRWWSSHSSSDPHLGQAGIPRSQVERNE